jgi:hypothetical protein
MDIAATLSTHLRGRVLSEVARREYDWVFAFAEGQSVTIACPWRVLAAGRIAFSDSDDGHKFGLPAPLDGVAAAKRLLDQRRIVGVTVRPDTGDLSIAFEGETVLEVLNLSSGYEGWQANVPGKSVIAQGGGNIVVIPAD